MLRKPSAITDESIATLKYFASVTCCTGNCESIKTTLTSLCIGRKATANTESINNTTHTTTANVEQ